MKRSRREVFTDIVIQRDISKNNEISLCPCFIPSNLKQGLGFTVYLKKSKEKMGAGLKITLFNYFTFISILVHLLDYLRG